jgi:alanine racemase
VAFVRGRLPATTRFIAVLKANGYGHGARMAAKAALEAGAWGLAVVTLAEAAELRDLLPPERLLVLGPLLPDDAPEAVASGHLLGCSSLQVARALEAAAGAWPVAIHAKLDSGMGRYGATPAEFKELVDLVRSSDRLELAGTWTHFASSDSDPAYTRQQLDRFLEATAGLPGLRHAANSGGALHHPEAALDAVRVGIAMYGCEDPRLEPVLQLRAAVAQLKTLPPGDSVGYGRTWTASRPARIATVAIGYADGVHRGRSNRGEVLLRGRRVPLVGQVSMDSITIDVSDCAEVELGDPVTLIGRDGEERIRAEEVAGWSGTISYEVLTSIGTRVQRIFT